MLRANPHARLSLEKSCAFPIQQGGWVTHYNLSRPGSTYGTQGRAAQMDDGEVVTSSKFVVTIDTAMRALAKADTPRMGP
jgi:hypothetical protein